jgi:hypothetical protein
MSLGKPIVVVIAGVGLCAINVPFFYWVSGGHNALIVTLLAIGVIAADLIVVRFLIYYLMKE